MCKHAIQWPSAVDASTIDLKRESLNKLRIALEQKTLVDGTVLKLEKYGVFVGIARRTKGLLHISDITNEWVHDPAVDFKKGKE